MEGISYSEIVQTVLQKRAELGIPKTDIVLGFRSPYLRQFAGFGMG